MRQHNCIWAVACDAIAAAVEMTSVLSASVQRNAWWSAWSCNPSRDDLSISGPIVGSNLASPFKSKVRLEAENAVLRHQLIVLKRSCRGRVRLTNHDRLFFIQLYRWSPLID
jgi:hypothetical protein